MNDPFVGPLPPATSPGRPARGVRVQVPVLPLWAWLVWAGVSLAITVIVIPVSAAVQGVPVVTAFVFGILLGGSVILTLVAPRSGPILQAIALAVLATTADRTMDPWPVPVLGIISLAAVLVALSLYGRWRSAIALWVSVMLFMLVVVDTGATTDESVADLIVAASVSGAAIVFAIVFRLLVIARRRASEAEHEVEVVDADRRWQQERARIAREMHDVVAHSMSIVHMRATSARYRIDGLGDEAIEEFDGIALQARSALGEMRGLLGVLREDQSVLDAPQPGFHELHTLVASTRDAGVTIRDDLVDIVPEPPASVQLALFRVLQESLSNVVRHALGADVDVRLTLEGGSELVLTVHNTRPPHPVPAPDRGGHGIRGMMERMASVDGRLDHGTTPDGGYLVTARAPYRRSTT